MPLSPRVVPRGVIALGFVSMFMDMSSEIVHSLLPIFLTVTFGASVAAVGVIEGVAEATAAIAKIFSGVLSDRIGKRKPLILLGYGLATLTKPLFPLAGSIGVIFAARFIDRIGKGIRGAPRDALVADITEVKHRGAAYGLRQSLDTVGAIAGPALALVLMGITGGNFAAVFWVACIPAVICVGIIVVFIKEPERSFSEKPPHVHLDLWRLKGLNRKYWGIVAVGFVFTLARFSDAFLVLRAGDVGAPLMFVPLSLVAMNALYTFTSYPIGKIADSMSHRALLLLGMLMLICANLVLASADNFLQVLTGAAIWGIHMGMTQGLFAAMVADAAPAHLRATAFGLFHLLTGVGVLLASLIAGGLWSLYGAPVTFLAGASFAGLALVGLIKRRSPS